MPDSRHSESMRGLMKCRLLAGFCLEHPMRCMLIIFNFVFTNVHLEAQRCDLTSHLLILVLLTSGLHLCQIFHMGLFSGHWALLGLAVPLPRSRGRGSIKPCPPVPPQPTSCPVSSLRRHFMGTCYLPGTLLGRGNQGEDSDMAIFIGDRL
jgi:hypothetical protein